MKHILILFLALFMSFNTFGQIAANKVTSIKGKLNKDKLEFKKTDAKIWVFIQTENNGGETRIELNEVAANASLLTLEQKELGVKIVIDVVNLSAIAYSLNEAKQFVESTETTITIESADDSESVKENDDKIDSKITPKNVSLIKWEHIFAGTIFTLEQSSGKNWTFTKKSRLGGGTPETVSLIETKKDANSIYFSPSSEEGSTLELKIDLVNKKVFATEMYDQYENGKWIKKRMEEGFMSDESQQKFLSIK
jgi:hypothetical protein